MHRAVSLLGRSWNLPSSGKEKPTSALICTVLVDNGLCWGGAMRFPVFEHTLKRMFEKRKKYGSKLSSTKALAKAGD